MGPGDLMVFFIYLIKKADFSILLLDLLDGGVEDRINLGATEYIADLLADIFVFFFHQSGGRIDNGDLASKPSKHLSKLQPDIPTSQYEQVVRGFLQVHNGGTGKIGGIPKAFNRRYDRFRTGVDKQLIGPDGKWFALRRLYLNLFIGFKRAPSLDDVHVFGFFQPRLRPAPKKIDNIVFPFFYGFLVHRITLYLYTKIRCAAYLI